MADTTARARLEDLRRKVRAIESRTLAPPRPCGEGEVALPPGLHEARPDAYFDAPAALTYLAARAQTPLVWIACKAAGQDFGTLSPAALAAWGLNPTQVIHVAAPKVADALWAMEAALKAGVPHVVGEVGAGEAYDLAASRRLQMAAEATGASVWALRSWHAPNPTAALTRWRIAALPGSQATHKGAVGLPGLAAPRWRAVLERAHARLGHVRPQTFDLEWDHEAHRLRLAAEMADRPARRAAVAEQPTDEPGDLRATG
ncbi:MAG: hypothetical protein PVI23_14300 [Maricaulaceae bacterium]